jgi:hypothetical protein
MIEVETERYKNYIIYCIKGTNIYHREDGPAIEFYYGHKEWLVNGKLHREDGPAVIYEDGSFAWYLNNKHLCTKEAWFEALNEEQRAKALYSEYFIGG